MKNVIKITFIFLLTAGNIFGQQEKGIIGASNWLNNWTEFNPSQKDYGEVTQILTGNISKDTKLFKKYKYQLLGNVFVADSTTLTIEPGTVIIGDYKSKASLTISKGATLIADGLETDPIVFTSNRSVKRAGDWGGLIILGDAPMNKFGNGSASTYYTDLDPSSYGNVNYGGQDAASNSGVLRYVRIEYAGKRVGRTDYFSGLLLACVGSETVLENIMVSYAAANSFEIIGGEVNLNNAVSYKSNGNDFKFNNGTQSKLFNSLAVRSPYISSVNGSRCIQVLSYENKQNVDFNKKGTYVDADNLTLLNSSDNLANDIKMGLVKESVFVGENAALDMNKTVISGFNPAVLFDEKITVNQTNLERIKFSEMYFNNCNGNIFVEYNSNNEDLENWYGNSAFFNVYSKGMDSQTFIDANNTRSPDYRLKINKIIATNDIEGNDK
jgi:hypothetical protein